MDNDSQPDGATWETEEILNIEDEVGVEENGEPVALHPADCKACQRMMRERIRRCCKALKTYEGQVLDAGNVSLENLAWPEPDELEMAEATVTLNRRRTRSLPILPGENNQISDIEVEFGRREVRAAISYCPFFGLVADHPGFRLPPNRASVRLLSMNEILSLCFAEVFEELLDQPAPAWLPYYAHWLPFYPTHEPFFIEKLPRMIPHFRYHLIHAAIQRYQNIHFSLYEELRRIATACLRALPNVLGELYEDVCPETIQALEENRTREQINSKSTVDATKDSAYGFLQMKIDEGEVTGPQEDVAATNVLREVDAYHCELSIFGLRQHADDYTIRLVGEDLEQCDLLETELRALAPLPKSLYERQEYELILNATLRLYGADNLLLECRRLMTLYLLAAKFCKANEHRIYERKRLALPLKDAGIDKHIIHKQISFQSLMIGNMTTSGVFLVRGDYFTGENQISNERMKPLLNSRQAFVADRQNELSFATFEHDMKVMKFYFGVRIPPQDDGLIYDGYQMKIDYGSIVSLTLDCSEPEQTTLIFHMKHPPQLFRAIPKRQAQRTMNLLETREWERELGWPSFDESVGCSKESLGNNLYIALRINNNTDKIGANQERYVIDENYPHIPAHFLTIIGRISERAQIRVFTTPIVFRRCPEAPKAYVPNIGSFRANYTIHALISRGAVVTDQIFHRNAVTCSQVDELPFFRSARLAYQECPLACETALENLLVAVDERRDMNLTSAFQEIYRLNFSDWMTAYNEAKERGVHMTEVWKSAQEIPKNCVLVRKVMVCPLRTLLMAPEVMLANRVVRHFGEEKALRCVFRDDSGQTLRPFEFFIGNAGGAQTYPRKILDIISKAMMEEVKVVDRCYKFLAWSNSQMRDYGCYLYAANTRKDIEKIRDWMGDFSMCTSVPKMMSRMGQCFTQAQPTVRLGPCDWIVEDDYVGGSQLYTQKEFCFSDGVGRISYKLAVQIQIMLELTYVPSCFQVRFKGFKGVLTIDPQLDGYTGPKVVFRKSQEKFQDTTEGDSLLEIVKYAMLSPVCLNRPLINIIDQVAHKQGPDVHLRISRTIHRYLERELSVLTRMLLDENDAAMALCQRLPIPVNYQRILECGITMTDEPFFRRLLLAVYKHNITQHLSRSKMKIFLPLDLGRTMYGVVDDTGLLQSGQVFIQYSTTKIRDKIVPGVRKESRLVTQIYQGTVLVSKNPCHVAGDVRLFEAIDQPALHHLFDVIVFPQHGPRPHPDEMAGSDLDGDEYSVIFDERCFFDHNEAAMSFPAAEEGKIAEKLPTHKDMVQFFMRYLSQDSIGRLSNAHLRASDYYGLFSAASTSIAKKCSVAVDFPKTGKPADNLSPDENVDSSPDYMEHRSKAQFMSRWLNGQLYRKIKRIDNIIEEVDTSSSPFDAALEPHLFPEGWNPFEARPEKQAEIVRLFKEYSLRMQSLLDEYTITDEAQVVSGHIVSLKRLTSMEKDDYSFFHTDKIVEVRYAAIFTHFRKQFFNEFGDEERLIEDGFTEEMELRARQWYAVAYDKHSSRTFLSFPWVVWDVLASAKRRLLLSDNDPNVLVRTRSKVASRLSDIAGQMRRIDAAFHELIRDFEVVERYAAAFGDGILDMLYVLYRWLDNKTPTSLWEVKDNNFVSRTTRYLAHLLFQYCHVRPQGTDHYNDDYKPPVTFPNTPKYGVPVESPLGTVSNPGEVVLSFLRYLGSKSFCDNSSYLDLDLQDGAPDALILCDEDIWRKISQVAYKTTHYVAVTGRFEWLGIDSGCPTSRLLDVKNTVAETRDPIVVHPDLMRDLTGATVSEALREWSGCLEVRFRERQNRSLVSGVGDIRSRQRLARILLMPANILSQAIREQNPPYSIINDLLDE